jgi:hypothetical protein
MERRNSIRPEKLQLMAKFRIKPMVKSQNKHISRQESIIAYLRCNKKVAKKTHQKEIVRIEKTIEKL